MPTVMIVDDAAFMRMALKEILTKIGSDVIAEAGDGLFAAKSSKLKTLNK